ncbi:MAG: nitrate reductase molybdenum cofactor assembly chaperone [Pseudomonas piscis]|uniref:nitrate reductase molybdenum cofactor assembly chaperone n=1 Tax=Pseudomonas piscis TaxID=2614538 RepID=UPI003D2D814D
MRILKVISLLLDYPTQELVAGRDELEQAIIQAREISPRQRGALFELLELICNNDLMDRQEHYGALFGRGRSLSLLLFEHVHGESRDRGQAMVDLLAQYEAAGFALGVKELPDYIPLYLEYLSTRDELEAREGLDDVAHLLALLAARLEERESFYAGCFRALLQIAGAEPHQAVADVREQVAAEQRDDSLEALDKIWEEEAVDFLQAQQQDRCAGQASASGKPREESAVPLHWVDFQDQGLARKPAGEVGNV